MRLVFFGPPGAGKGTQAARLTGACGLAHLSVGDMLRAEMAAETPLGKKARAIMATGKLMPGNVIASIMRNALKENRKPGFILDGFPRTLTQARALEEILDAISQPLDGVVSFSIDEAAVRARMRNRAAESGGGTRVDDNEQAFTIRMKTYHDHARPLEEHYRAQNLLLPVNAEGGIEEVSRALLGALEEKGISIPR